MTLAGVIQQLRDTAAAADRQERIVNASLTWWQRFLARRWGKHERLRMLAAAYYEKQALIVASNEILRRAKLDAMCAASPSTAQSFLRPLPAPMPEGFAELEPPAPTRETTVPDFNRLDAWQAKQASRRRR